MRFAENNVCNCLRSSKSYLLEGGFFYISLPQEKLEYVLSVWTLCTYLNVSKYNHWHGQTLFMLLMLHEYSLMVWVFYILYLDSKYTYDFFIFS